MKYVLFYPDKLSQPSTAFFLNFIHISAVWLIKSYNLLKSMDRKKPDQVIVRFVSFELISNLPKLLISSLESFSIKGPVGKLTLDRNRNYAAMESNIKAKLPFSLCLLNLVYCLYK